MNIRIWIYFVHNYIYQKLLHFKILAAPSFFVFLYIFFILMKFIF